MNLPQLVLTFAISLQIVPISSSKFKVENIPRSRWILVQEIANTTTSSLTICTLICRTKGCSAAHFNMTEGTCHLGAVGPDIGDDPATGGGEETIEVAFDIINKGMMCPFAWFKVLHRAEARSKNDYRFSPQHLN